MKFKAHHLLGYFIFCIICALAEFTYFKQNLTLNLIVYLVHLALSFYILKRISGKIFIQDVRVIFLISYALYTIVLPLSVLFDSQTVLYNYSFNDVGVNGTLILSTLGLFGFNCALLKFQVPWIIQTEKLHLKKITNAFPAIFFLILIIFSILIFLYVKGIRLTLNVENGRLATGSQLYIFLTLLLNGAFLFLFSNFSRFKKNVKIFVVSCFLFYAYVMLVPLGARRELLPVISLLTFFLFEKYNASLKNVFLIIFISLFFIVIGAIRELDKANTSTANVFKYVMVNNEFSIPPRHTIAYLNNNNWHLLLGWSYVYFPIIFIPRDFLGGYKPLSLAWQTDILFHTSSSGAAAFTPITEAYINFSWIGPVVVFFILAYFLSYSVKTYKTNPVLYLLVFINAFDFNRGEFSLILYAMAFLYLGYLITKILASTFKKNDVTEIINV